jgi:hypothetical protein
MSDIISARCFGCGHIIKVPAALGGKKARCPQCTNTITIPAMHETSDDIVGDDQLTEVAREGDPVEDDQPLMDAAEEPVEGDLVEGPATTRRRTGTAPRRGGASSSANLRAQPAARGTGSRYAPAPARKSGAGTAVAVALGVLVVGGIVVALAMGDGAPRKGASRTDATQGTNPVAVTHVPAIDEALQSRCLDYIEAVNKGDPAKLVRFFPPEEEGSAMRDVNRFLEQRPAYSAYEVVKADAKTGVAVFRHAGGEKSLTFKLVAGTWYVGEKPTP